MKDLKTEGKILDSFHSITTIRLNSDVYEDFVCVEAFDHD